MLNVPDRLLQPLQDGDREAPWARLDGVARRWTSTSPTRASTVEFDDRRRDLETIEAAVAEEGYEVAGRARVRRLTRRRRASVWQDRGGLVPYRLAARGPLA